MSARERDNKVSTINLANLLTFIRIMLIPVFAVFLIISQSNNTPALYTAVVIFCVAMITDNLDGYIARKFNLVTELGKLIDPIADKLLVGVAIILLTYYQLIPWWIAILIIFREVFVTLLRLKNIGSGAIAAQLPGKAKTFLQTFAVLCTLIYPIRQYSMFINILWFITMVITIYSGWLIVKNIE